VIILKLRFIDYDAAKSEIGVAVADFDYEEQKNDLDALLQEETAIQFSDYDACGVNHLGLSHSSDEHCANQIYNGYDGTYCPILRCRELRIERANLPFISSMLDYYWQRGIEKDGFGFLESSQFITRYEYNDH
jgi:hypothetical protein